MSQDNLVLVVKELVLQPKSAANISLFSDSFSFLQFLVLIISQILHPLPGGCFSLFLFISWSTLKEMMSAVWRGKECKILYLKTIAPYSMHKLDFKISKKSNSEINIFKKYNTVVP